MKKKTPNTTYNFQDTLAVFHLDRACRIIGINKNAELLIKQPIADLFGKSMDEILIFKEETASLAQLFEQTGWGEAISRQSLLLNADQNRPQIDVLATVIPLWGQDRALSGALVTLDTNNQSFYHQLLLDSLSEGVLTVNRSLKIISFNRAAELITGWRQEDVLGKYCQEVFPPELCENKCLIKHAIEDETSLASHTVFMPHKDGHFFPLSLTSSPLYDLNGQVIGGVQTFHDSSDALNNALILASIADGVFTIDQNRVITSFNRAAEDITGWKQDEVIGKPCREIFHSSVCGEACLLQMAIDHNSTYIDRAIFI